MMERREQLETYLLAGIGLIQGIGRYVLWPLIEDGADKVRHIHPANITYYNTGEADERSRAGSDRVDGGER